MYTHPDALLAAVTPAASSRRGRIRLFIRRLCTDVGLDLPRDALCHHVHDTLINSCVMTAIIHDTKTLICLPLILIKKFS